MLAISGGAWTAAVAGLVALPILGMIYVVADAADAYRDLVYVRLSGRAGQVEEEQARHTLYAQMARAVVLVAIATMALLELADVLTGDGIALLVYIIAVVGVGDAWRARRVRKRMVRMLEGGDDDD